MPSDKPLVLDVDGTFLRTDMLFECLWAGLGRAPLKTLGICLRWLRNPARLKAELAELAPLRTELLPVNPQIAELAMHAQDAGREVVLASASDQRLVAQLAEDYGFAPEVLGSDGAINMKAGRKAEALVEAFGQGGFDYAGDSKADLAVWPKAGVAHVVGRPRDADALAGKGYQVVSYAGGWRWRALIKAMRPHQWVKNVLLLLPMIASHEFGADMMVQLLLAIVAFSAAASSIYIVNDLLDLEADRLHATKCNRPFASGEVPIVVGMAAFLGLAVLALGIALALNPAFAGIVLLYMLTSLAYSLRLKRMRWVDIAALASLYTLRVVAGAAAGQVEASVYMLVFVFPVFIALGCVKRLTELALAQNDDRLPGRGYGRTDRGDLLNVAGLGTFGALLVFFLYSISDQGHELYPTTWILWVAMLPMAYWLIRMVVLGWRGRQDYDPIVFAMRDKLGLGVLMITLSLMFWAAGLWAQWFGG